MEFGCRSELLPCYFFVTSFGFFGGCVCNGGSLRCCLWGFNGLSVLVVSLLVSSCTMDCFAKCFNYSHLFGMLNWQCAVFYLFMQLYSFSCALDVFLYDGTCSVHSRLLGGVMCTVGLIGGQFFVILVKLETKYLFGAPWSLCLLLSLCLSVNFCFVNACFIFVLLSSWVICVLRVIAFCFCRNIWLLELGDHLLLEITGFLLVLTGNSGSFHSTYAMFGTWDVYLLPFGIAVYAHVCLY